MSKKVVITTIPFGEFSDGPAMLKSAGFNVDTTFLDRGKKPNREELIRAVSDVDAIVAGTEMYDVDVLSAAKNLKVLSRIGIGLDNVDFATVKKSGIDVTYTPDAVSRAVSEITLGLIINLARKISVADRGMHNGKWERHIGLELHSRTIGLIGLGRIGKLVVPLFRALGMTVLANDLEPDLEFCREHGIESVEKEVLFAKSDFVSLHVPLTPKTNNLINVETLSKMKEGAYLVNTSRGPVVNEDDLFDALSSSRLAGAAIDVFRNEPYSGPLTECPTALLTCHMGSCSDLARKRMEEEASQNVIDFFEGRTPAGRVPDEYRI
ncbi:MAG: phosphoglycerate dehydrogenase [Candidatus Lindowbacteria bacterium]|nr:phosphoglycerate dehydrogenase [Candidatus Lindowbacteria bacterium]